MKIRFLSMILATCILFISMAPLVIAASDAQMIVSVSEIELMPMVASSCPSPSTQASGAFRGYSYSYSSNAYIKYRLKHPDGRTIDIMSETNPSVVLARDYMSVIGLMMNAEDNAYQVTRALGVALDLTTILVTMGVSALVFKSLTKTLIAELIVNYLIEKGMGYLDKKFVQELIEAVLPDFCDIQELMEEADYIYDDLWDMVSDN